MKVFYMFLCLFYFSCGEETVEKCSKGSVYNNNYNICVANPCKEGVIREGCYQENSVWKDCYCIEGCFADINGHIKDDYCLAVLEQAY